MSFLSLGMEIFEQLHEKTKNLNMRNQRRRSEMGIDWFSLMAYVKTKPQISCAVTAKLISAFVFATQIVQFLYFLNPNFQPPAIFCACAARFVSNLFGNHIVGFPMKWLISVAISPSSLFQEHFVRKW